MNAYKDHKLSGVLNVNHVTEEEYTPSKTTHRKSKERIKDITTQKKQVLNHGIRSWL
jgi:hypothetical protein